MSGAKIFGLAGWSGAGKTTLLTRLIPLLTARGLRVSTIKYAHHDFDVDQPGKDSYLHRQAGAWEVMAASSQRWALMRELRGAPEPSLDELVARMREADLILVEGFRHGGHKKLEIHRASLGQPLLVSSDQAIVAVAADAPIPGLAIPVLALDDVAAIASFVLRFNGLG